MPTPQVPSAPGPKAPAASHLCVSASLLPHYPRQGPPLLALPYSPHTQHTPESRGLSLPLRLRWFALLLLPRAWDSPSRGAPALGSPGFGEPKAAAPSHAPSLSQPLFSRSPAASPPSGLALCPGPGTLLSPSDTWLHLPSLPGKPSETPGGAPACKGGQPLQGQAKAEHGTASGALPVPPPRWLRCHPCPRTAPLAPPQTPESGQPLHPPPPQ